MLHRAKILLFLAGMVLWQTSCDDNRVFELNQDLPAKAWEESDIKRFDFSIEHPEKSHDLIANIRYNADYPFRNLYVTWVLADSSGNTLETEMVNIRLFDEKTGRPLQKGISDLSFVQEPFMQGYRFPYAGKYSITMQQFMRRKSLPGIYSVGLRVGYSESAE